MNRLDLKLNLVHLLCLCNFSFRDPFFNKKFRIHKAVLTSSTSFYEKIISKEQKKLLKIQSIFHDLNKLHPTMNFDVIQYSRIHSFLKNSIYNNKIFYLKTEKLLEIASENKLKEFELTIFYYFANDEDVNDDSKIIEDKKIHNVFVIRSHQPVLVVYNPFQHNISK